MSSRKPTSSDRTVVLTRDPRFQGGALALLRAFLRAAAELGRNPRAAYAERPPLAGEPPVRGISVRPPFARVDPIGLPLAARSLGRAARERGHSSGSSRRRRITAWRPRRSGRPYACWIATSLDAEWAARRPALDPLRRAALAAFGPSLRRYERGVLRGARRVYATSPYTRATVAEAAGLDPAAVELLPIAVDLERFKPIDDEVWSRRSRARRSCSSAAQTIRARTPAC